MSGRPARASREALPGPRGRQTAAPRAERGPTPVAKPWVVYKGGYDLNFRRRGPGIVHKQGKTSWNSLDSTDARAATFKPNSPDAPKKASRTMPASWGQPFGGGR